MASSLAASALVAAAAASAAFAAAIERKVRTGFSDGSTPESDGAEGDAPASMLSLTRPGLSLSRTGWLNSKGTGSFRATTIRIPTLVRSKRRSAKSKGIRTQP